MFSLVCIFFLIVISIEQAVAVPNNKTGKEIIFKKKTYQIPKMKSKIEIDGILKEEAWKDALFITLDYEMYPGEGTPPPVKTECFLTYDNSSFYIAFRAYDPKPSEIRARFANHDKLWQDDKVGIVLDTFNDENTAFAFVINPLGVQRDLIYSHGGTEWNDSWDAIWSSAGRITDFGYVGEMAIPFSSLQFQRIKEQQTWGLELLRIYPRNQYYWIKNYPEDRNESCLLCKFPKLTGLLGIKPGRNIELDPTVTGIRTDERNDFPDGDFEKKESKIDPGLSGHWSITPNLMLSGAINPDFSQVEADAAQLDINKQFALFYAEKRPFFLEGLDFFKTPLDTVYTRTMADPDWGVKLSGKEGKHAIGFFTAQDHMTNLLFPGSEGSSSTSINRKSYSTVLRYRRDIGSASTLGLLVTDREGKGYHNRLAGIDCVFKIKKSDMLTFQFLGSHTQYPDEISENFNQDKDGFNGTALAFSYLKKKRTYFWEVAYHDFSPGFRADLGFIPQVDFRKLKIDGGYTHWGKQNAFFTQINISGNFYQIEKHNRLLIERKAELFMDFSGPLQSYLSYQIITCKRIYNDVSFNQTYGNLYFEINPQRDLIFNFSLTFGDEIDYIHTRAGKRIYFRPEINYNLGKHLNLVLNYSFDRLKLDQGWLFTAKLPQMNLIYFLNARTFIRLIMQYTDIDRNLDLYDIEVDRKFKKLYFQFLFSYKLNPRTVLFLGYNDNHLGYLNIPLTRTNRTFFVKIGYALTL